MKNLKTEMKFLKLQSLKGNRCILEFDKPKAQRIKMSMLHRHVGFSVTEDLSKKTREARLELRKFMREVKRKNPEKNCFMEQDKLFVDGKIYVFSETENRVVEQRIAEKIFNKNEKNRWQNTAPLISFRTPCLFLEF